MRRLAGSSCVNAIPLRPEDGVAARPRLERERVPAPALGDARIRFRAEVTGLFTAHQPRLFRYLDRLSNEPDLAADIVQEAFLKLYQRGTLPDSPEAWLISVALNLFRNAKTTRGRRRSLLTIERARAAHSDASLTPAQHTAARAERERVRRALESLPERERHLLLLHTEGYSYREMAEALDLNENSVGTLLARARTSFRLTLERQGNAP
jgi:RNA polymerase sigma-70 factor (ECF subfamily)